MQNHDNSRDLRPTFGLVSLRTELRKSSHDRARKTAAIEKARDNEARKEVNEWRDATRDVIKAKI